MAQRGHWQIGDKQLSGVVWDSFDGRSLVCQDGTSDAYAIWDEANNLTFDPVAPPPPVVPPVPDFGFARMANGGAPQWPDPAVTAGRYTYIVCNWWEASHIADVKAVNPGVRAFAYLNGSRLRNKDSAGNMSAVPAQDYPNLCGLADSTWSGLYLAKLGPDFTAAWLATAKALLAQYPVFDGIFMDDLNPGHDGLANRGGYSQSTWAQLLLTHVTGIRSEWPSDKTLIANLNGCAGQYEQSLRPFFPLLDGGVSEYFAGIWSATTTTTAFADGERAVAAALADKLFIANAPGGSQAALDLALSMDVAAFGPNDDYNKDQWSSAMENHAV